MGFVNYMLAHGWDVVLCETEADVEIAKDAVKGDIVISVDSDFLGYKNISTLWRPVSRDKVLVYDISVVVKTLGYTQEQFAALVVVSRNDYERNIQSLGPATNYGIIKKLNGADAREIVSAYLHDKVVIRSNKSTETFATSIQVFIDMRQTVITPVVLRPASQDMRDILQSRFKELCAQRDKMKSMCSAENASTRADPIVRLDRPKSFNRYRTVESPRNVLHNTSSIEQRLTLALAPKSQPPIATQDSSPIAISSTSHMKTHLDPQDDGHPSLNRTRIPKQNNRRYSFKQRTRYISHPPPPTMKKFTWKPYKPRDPPTTTNTQPKPKTKKKVFPKKPTADMNKNGLMCSISRHHPISSLDVGTLPVNIRRVFANSIGFTNPDASSSTGFQEEVLKCIQEAVLQAAATKREAQQLIGLFVDTIRKRMDEHEEKCKDEMHNKGEILTEEARLDARKKSIDPKERAIMKCLCADTEIKAEEEEADNDGDDLAPAEKAQYGSNLTDSDGKGSFFLSFLTFLYSGNRPRTTSRDGIPLNNLIEWLIMNHFLNPPHERRDLNVRMIFTPVSLVRSVSTELETGIRRMYGQGTFDLHKKASALKAKGILNKDVYTEIQRDISAVENFLYLNRLTSNSRRIVPMSSSRQPFVCFSENDLVHFFWKRPVLKQRLIQFASEEDFHVSSTQDLTDWVSYMRPGYIIKRFLCDVAPADLSSRERRKAGHRAAIKLMSLDEIRAHIEYVRSATSDPSKYNASGYIMHGSIRTDGFRLMLLTYKLRELQAVRFCQMPRNLLPDRLTSTIGGVDYKLPEIRNVFKSAEDVERYFPGAHVEDIKTLTLDAGQACIVGAFAYIPEHDNPNNTNGMDDDLSAAEGSLVRDRGVISSWTNSRQVTAGRNGVIDKAGNRPNSTPVLSPKHTFHNLAVKSKAVYQPVLRFRRWLENEKAAVPEGETKSIAEIESGLSPLNGASLNVVEYVKDLKSVDERLQEFYNGNDNKYRRHRWDMQRAQHAEFQLIAERLFNIVGGSSGRKRDPNNHVLIGIGLGKFQSVSGLSSLHSSFLDFFVKKARSLGFTIIEMSSPPKIWRTSFEGIYGYNSGRTTSNLKRRMGLSHGSRVKADPALRPRRWQNLPGQQDRQRPLGSVPAAPVLPAPQKN
ncbi:hypothetical protein FBU30_001514, partial [Linnemannia zychae]